MQSTLCIRTGVAVVFAVAMAGAVGWASTSAQDGVCPANPSPPDTADPSIVVEQPQPGARVTSPVTVSGMARVFEATVSIAIFDASGTVVAEAVTTATEAAPALSPFVAAVPFPAGQEQAGCIRVFEVSPRDGSPVNVVQVPVTLGGVPQPPATGTGGGDASASTGPEGWLLAAGASLVAAAGAALILARADRRKG
jgi:hypothetical protein